MSDDKRKKAEAAIMQYINGLFGRTEGYARAVSRHFTTAVNALLDLAAKADMAPDEVFYFADDKRLSAKATAIIRGLYSAVYQEIRNGVIAEWGNANAATDLMLTRLFGKGLKEDNHFARWFARNQEAMDSFFSRKDVHGGLNLSQKVWKYTSQFKEEMELAISASLGRGDSAATVSRHVRQYLKEPERLFRRVRDADGNLKLSKRAAAYHPGRGEYRSSYKNAMRLARTETNAAYRAADCDRWGSIPFVVGMEVKRSNHPFGCEVCELLKGKYPKDFVFTGWHPQCRCYIVPVLADEKERMAYHRAVLNGEDVSDWHFKGEITEPHKGFQKWIGENQERIENAKSLPYWIKDNPKYAEFKKHGYTGDKFGHKANAKEKAALSEHQELHDYSPEQEKNFIDISNATGYERGLPMSFDDADHGRANIYNDKDNCAVCVLVHELRLRGYDITSLPYKEVEDFTSLSKNTRSIWLTKKGKMPEFTSLIEGNEREITLKMEKATQGVGSRYHLGWDNKMGRGHIITVVRTKEGLVLYDPQKNEYYSMAEIIQEMMPGSKIELLRVDRLLVNPKSLDTLTESIV